MKQARIASPQVISIHSSSTSPIPSTVWGADQHSNNKPEASGTKVGRFTVNEVSSHDEPTSTQADTSGGVSSNNKSWWGRKQTPDQRRSRPSITQVNSSHIGGQSPNTNLTLYADDLRHHEKKMARIVYPEEQRVELHKANLGTFLGVFLPCCQNIVGVIFFVRFPWIVGTAGVVQGLLIVGMCSMVSVCTAISISAIATNGRVTAGGTYFMISRSLGPGCGGSVGILFFMGTSISVAMYYIGTIETLLNYIAPELSIFGEGKQEDPGRYNDYRLYGTMLLTIMGSVVFVGVTCVQRFAFCAIIFLATGITAIVAGFFMPNDDVSACKLGSRLMIYKLVHENGTWQCDKAVGGPIYNAYCLPNGTCDDYFTNNDVRLIKPMPGLQWSYIMDTLWPAYSEVYMIPNTDIPANQYREVVTDITTSFVVLMGIYFPSITGVESGSNYSGDLKNPHRSIPKGTLLAVTVTTTLYMSSVVFFAGAVDGDVLRDKYGMSISDSGSLVISLVAWPNKWIVLVATLTATVGAGLQALAGGPRLLQAIAEDNIFPSLSFFAKRWNGEPTRCLAVTFVIALSGILMARLDNVAKIVTMFFLMCYGFVNFAVTLQSMLDLPHWRPSFRCYHWIVTLFGTALCITIMFITSWIYAVAAITLAFCLYQYIEFKGAEKEWGDGMTGLSMTAAIFSLSRLRRTYHHTKSWRPQLLVLMESMLDGEEDLSAKDEALLHLSTMLHTGRPQMLVMLKTVLDGDETISIEDEALLSLSTMLQTGRGLCMYGSVVRGALADEADSLEEKKELFGNVLDSRGIKGFVEVVVAPNVSEGLCYMIQSAGLGPLRPNTVILGWPKDWMVHRNILSYNVFIETMRNIDLTDNSVLVLKCDDFPDTSQRMTGFIDVWWIVNDGGLLLLLSHLMNRHKTWKGCHIRVFAVADKNEDAAEFEKALISHLFNLRVPATVKVVEMQTGDISSYVYERTLKMEERSRMLEMLANARRNSKRIGRASFSVRDNSFTGTQSSCNILSSGSRKKDTDKPVVPSEKNMQNMRTAIQLNTLLKEESGSSDLIILNMPSAPEHGDDQANYMSFLEVLTEGLNRLLLVRGTGAEVITIFN